MKIYNVFSANMDFCPNELIHSFASRELAEKMVELYEKHSYLRSYIKNEYYIEEMECIDSFENELFDVKTLNCLMYDGEELGERSLNSLIHDSGPWGEFLSGNYYAMDSFHTTYERIHVDSDERQTCFNLHISRPKELGVEAIKKEWNELFHRIYTLYENGTSQDEINVLLKNNKV